MIKVRFSGHFSLDIFVLWLSGHLQKTLQLQFRGAEGHRQGDFQEEMGSKLRRLGGGRPKVGKSTDKQSQKSIGKKDTKLMFFINYRSEEAAK